MEHLGLPLVVMLATPKGVLLDLRVENLIYSLYGDLTYTFPVSPETGGATEPAQFVAGRNGQSSVRQRNRFAWLAQSTR